jgi:hypothetical protein
LRLTLGLAALGLLALATSFVRVAAALAVSVMSERGYHEDTLGVIIVALSLM